MKGEEERRKSLSPQDWTLSGTSKTTFGHWNGIISTSYMCIGCNDIHVYNDTETGCEEKFIYL